MLTGDENMKSPDPHLSEQDLLLAADGELPTPRVEEVRAHLAGCWTCRTRVQEIDSTISDFIRARESAAAPLPPAEGPRALLKLRLAQVTESSTPSLWEQAAAIFDGPAAAAVALSVALALGILVLRSVQQPGTAQIEVRAIPDSRLTPGATLPLTRDDICGGGIVDATRVVPVEIAKAVFAAYGVESPTPRAYEVDYLITPALGGSDNIRNFWPQPYGNTIWNAHIKDALEDHLRHLVCKGRLNLATAQREIATDWISAYRKYFRTQAPLPQHSSFLKDRPWE
jgi:hypothetical protein